MSMFFEVDEEPPPPCIPVQAGPSLRRLVLDLLICLAFGTVAAMFFNLFYCGSRGPKEVAVVHELTHQAAVHGSFALACALIGANRLSHIFAILAGCWRLAGNPELTDPRSTLFATPGPTPPGNSSDRLRHLHESMPQWAPGTCATTRSPPTWRP